MKTDWNPLLKQEFGKPYWEELQSYVYEERTHSKVFPEHEEVFTAFQLTPYRDVKILILGQDPYHGPGQGHGMLAGRPTLPGARGRRQPGLRVAHVERDCCSYP